MSPAETALLTKILAGSGVVFVIAFLGNLLSFSNRFLNALVTALAFAVIYAGLYYLIDQTMLPAELRNISQEKWIQMVATAAALVFVLDFVANMISFSSRVGNALVTAILFAVLFAGLAYATGGLPSLPKPA
ncbi:MAG: hypothetical protein ACK4MF_05555 [Hyphomicrobiaceae bacterium]